MWIKKDIHGKEQVWYSEKLIKRIKDECVKAQDNTGMLIFKMIEMYERKER